MNIENSNDGRSGRANAHAVKSRRRFRLIAFAAALVVFGASMVIVGYLIGSRGRATTQKPEPGQAQTAQIRYWTCSMHPQIKVAQKGKCPICFMDLVPVYETGGGGRTEQVRLALSETARKLAEIETSPVDYRPLSAVVRMLGKVDYDETRLSYVSAWVPGRIDKLYVNYVGVRVAKGEHLIYLYSPELRTAQEEFLIASRRLLSARQTGDADEVASALIIKEATEKKLQLWGILPAQIEEIERTNRSEDHTTIFASIGGTVISREAYEGKYVEAGERLFTIADLSAVWAMLDAYEIDLGWLRYGESVEFETDSFPGEVFNGRIAFIQPFVNEMTRTVKVRVNVQNPNERLKPGMFVRARVEATLNEAGRVKEPDLAGKWMCTMHPEVVKDSQGVCDICEMKLVESVTLGFGRPGVPEKKVLSIPASAPLLTGTRAVVYVEQHDADEVFYSAREVRLGPLAGDWYVVLSGLEEGERVVTRGNFKIDAALQIQAKPSMMKPRQDREPPGYTHPAPPQKSSGVGDKP